VVLELPPRQPVGDKYVHSATRCAWWQTPQFCQNKIAAAWLQHIIATGNYVPAAVAARQLLRAAAVRAPGIAAESPQELHWQFRGLAAESPAPARERRGGARILAVFFVFAGVLEFY
jgi:hypothetical protein